MQDAHDQPPGDTHNVELSQAEHVCRLALQRTPGDPQLLYRLAYLCHTQGRTGEAIALLQQACARDPGNTGMRYSLAALLELHGEPEQAERRYRENLQLDPAHSASRIALAVLDIARFSFGDAIRQLETVLAQDGSNALALYNLGLARMRTGQSWLADDCFSRAIQADPGLAPARTCRLHNLHNLSGVSRAMLFEAHRAQGSTLAGTARPAAPTAHGVRHSGTLLRVGYVSADLRRHSVAAFLLPVLQAHDRGVVASVCYSAVARPDDMTARLRAAADDWRDISALDDSQAETLIRQDGIDILVDLSGHTDGNRLPLFARRPAPLQVTWLGYPDTTGLDAIDYRLTDAYTDPPGSSEAFHTETLLRLDPCFLCYSAPPQQVEVRTAPCAAPGHITYGSFNNLAKLSDDTLDAWSAILLRTPGSRMLLKAKGLGDDYARKLLYERFAARGIESQRIECAAHIDSSAGHLELYNRVDIALDTFPYNGTTTTCEALWMSVPVITLAGDRHAARVGLSLLHAAGRPELAAASVQEYIDLASTLAADPARLAQLRGTLRGTLRGSALMDSTSFTRRLEQAFRLMANAGGTATHRQDPAQAGE